MISLRPFLCTLGIAMLCTACRHGDEELGRLSRRVDSMAVTLTSLTVAMQGRGPSLQSDSLTVSAFGAGYAGSKDARVVVVEFTDYECPFCAKHATTTFTELKRDYIDRGLVRYVVRDLPLSDIHPVALAAAYAARCAGSQAPDKYWAYHDGLFAKQRQLTREGLGPMASAIGLDRDVFDKCMASGRFDEAVKRDLDEAGAIGITATPAFVIGRVGEDDKIAGVAIRGAYPYAQFKLAIESALAAGTDGSGR